jgi:hypothetical protein
MRGSKARRPGDRRSNGCTRLQAVLPSYLNTDRSIAAASAR